MNKQNIKFVRGNPERNTEIEKMLTELGVKNASAYILQDPLSIYYFTDEDKWIKNMASATTIGQLIIENCEELFLPAKFKYKVGDRVLLNAGQGTHVNAVVKSLSDIKGRPWYDIETICGISTHKEESLKPNSLPFKFKNGDAVEVKESDKENEYLVGTIIRCLTINNEYNQYTISTSSGLYEIKENDLELYDTTKIKFWEDLEGTPLKGFYIDTTSDEGISEVLSDEEIFTMADKATAATEAVAKSMVAMAQISQLMRAYGGEITEDEWKSIDIKKWVVFRDCNEIKIDYTYRTFMYLAFHTEEQAERFLANNKRLVKDYLQIK